MFNGTAAPPGEGRPAWKILRVLGNQLELEGFDYESAEDVRDELKSLCRDIRLDNSYTLDNIELPSSYDTGAGLLRCGDLPATNPICWCDVPALCKKQPMHNRAVSC